MGADTLEQAKSVLLVLLKLMKTAPIPEPFKSVVVGIPDAVLQIIAIVETAKGNMKDAKVLALYIATVTDRTIRPVDFTQATDATKKRIHEFEEALGQITSELGDLASRRQLRKWVVGFDRDAAKLAAMKQNVADIINGIQLETVVATSYEVEIMSQKQELLYQEQQGVVQRQQEAEIDRLIAFLGNGDSGSSKKQPCLDGTRDALLRRITQWIEQPPGDDLRGLCLIGAAGRGKSSVGASVARQERKLKRLGGEFYFMDDHQDRNEGAIPVLAQQLASQGDRRLRLEVASAVDEDRYIAQRTLEEQFQKLIQGPLEALVDDVDCPPLVILLDGLDECNNEYASQLLRLVGQSFATLPTTVKFIITSRPEPHLLRHYDSESLGARLHILSLDLEEVGEVMDDIEAFFKLELPRRVWGLVRQPSDWPGEVRRRILVRLSGGLWIWAVTVARMITDRNFRDPEKQLDALLSPSPNNHGEYGHNTDLYAIYSKILNQACSKTSPNTLLAAFRDVLGALHVAKVPMNTHTLLSLLCPDNSSSEDIRTKVLGYLRAVLIVPDADEDTSPRDATPIQFIHKSFQDYLSDEARCEARFLVDIAEHERRMTIRCLCRMEDLQKPSVYSLDPSTLVHRQGMATLARQYVSPALRYACENWASHISGVSTECDDVHEAVETFARTRLHLWLEVLSLLERMEDVIIMVGQMEAWLQARPPTASVSLEIPTPPISSLYHLIALIAEGVINMLTSTRFQSSWVHTLSGSLTLWILNYARSFNTGLTPVAASSPANTVPMIPLPSLIHDFKEFVTMTYERSNYYFAPRCI
ncbi:hypothetical protein FRB94_011634 [Tulasnella sp. JGI-2019a]|nr:hypothetical protein FRB94_011634 [Tulasnella sp. JGI-2019a]KAG9008679.1 hypothetical protein FRB93_006225 [Tulasnella sp. JGI-2019a]